MAIEDFTSNRTTQKVCKAAKATRKAQSRNKSRINPKVVANIIHLSEERKKENARLKWGNALKVYLATLDGNKFSIAEHVMMFISQRPRLSDPTYSCEIITFPSVKNQSNPQIEEY